jgi:hypothetical protein
MIKQIYPNSHANIHKLPVRVKAQHTHTHTQHSLFTSTSLTRNHPPSIVQPPQSFVFAITCAHHCESGHRLLLFGCLSVCPPAFSCVVFVLCIYLKHTCARTKRRTHVRNHYFSLPLLYTFSFGHEKLKQENLFIFGVAIMILKILSHVCLKNVENF